MINMWNDVRLQAPETSQIMLAYTRDDVFDLNQKARELRHSQGELGTEQGFSTFRGERDFAINDRIYFLKNDRNLGVMNGSLATITNVNNKALTVELDNTKREVVVDFDLYNHVDHGYAATIHKAQGVTVDRSYLLASKYLDAHATYVGMTRHRDSVDLFYSREEFPKYSDLVNNLSRDRAKDISIDYSDTQFAVNRNIVVKEELTKQPPVQSLVKESFPFKNKFSNLQEFTALDRFERREQDFNKLREELAEKFADPLNNKFNTGLFNSIDQSNFDFDKELNNIRSKQQQITEQVNQRKVTLEQEYSKVEPREVVRGIVGKTIELPGGNKMLEIIRGENVPTKLVPEHHFIKNERGKEIELKFDRQGKMTGMKNSQMLEKEAVMKKQQEQQKENLKVHREQILQLERDRGFER